MSRSTAAAFVISAIMLLAGGWVLGLVVDPAWVVGLQRPGPTGEDDHPAHDDEHEGHVHLTESAYKNLNLRIHTAKVREGKHTIQVPGEVVEKPGHSDHALAAPVNGVVTEVYALPGQAIRPGDELFKLQVIDEPLAAAQLNLLNTIARLITVEAELKRISPLADAGTVLGRKKLELQYEKDELELKQELYEQELEVRGLTEEQVSEIKESRKLIRQLVVRMPMDQHSALPDTETTSGEAPADEAVRPVSSTTMGADWEYTLEELTVFPGKSVERGDDLCHVAYHTSLYIRGEVFENELQYVLGLGEGQKSDWTVRASIGPDADDYTLEGLRIHYVDNHVNTVTQTYRFYVPITNEVVRDTTDSDGRRFRTWRFKPGQRVHIEVPTEPYSNMIYLPPSAVVIDGANAFVFREVVADKSAGGNHGHSHAAGADHVPHNDDVFLDLERVPVEVVFQNSEYILFPPDGELRPGDAIAWNNAYQIFLEQKSQAGGDTAGHGHEH